MPTRAAHILIFCGLGIFLALLATWVSGPSQDAVVVLQTPLQTSRTEAGTSESFELFSLLARLESNGELREPQRASLSRESDIEPPTTKPGRSGASSVNGALDVASERPLGWCFITTLNDDFISDSTTAWNGSRSVFMAKHEGGFESAFRVNTLWQGIDAAPYRGSRIEFSVYAKTRGGLLLFLDTATESELAPGRIGLHSVPPTNRFFPSLDADWTRLFIVGDIPPDADVIYYAVSHDGSASLWVDDVRITEVGAESPITEASRFGAFTAIAFDPSFVSAAPTNLNFELTTLDSKNGATNITSPDCTSLRIGSP